jgi:hypothetical protein
MGFSNVNYARAEVQNPARTLDSRALGYFGCGRLIPPVQPLLLRCCKEGGNRWSWSPCGFKDVWGPRTGRLLFGFVALSALGNVLSIVCTNSPTTICLLIFVRSSVVFTGKCQSSARSRGHPPIHQGVGFKPALWGSTSRINLS